MELLTKEAYPCAQCGTQRLFDKYAVARGRHLTLCRVCALRAYYKDKPKRSKEDQKAYMRAWAEKNRAHIREHHAEYTKRRRAAIIAALGGGCAHCGEADPVVLDVDHINDDGAAHRRATCRTNIAHLIATNIDRTRFQLLCKNCNWRKEYERRENTKSLKTAA